MSSSAIGIPSVATSQGAILSSFQNISAGSVALMEGPLSKWTNVMKGWQFRWFVLDENTGLLSYYTSKEKMRRGVRRGCIRLQGAVLGIDDEDDANFTITVDAKVFHLQAKDAEEREIWVRALEETILKHARLRPGSYLPLHFATNMSGTTDEPLRRFEHCLAQADAYLQLLIQQVVALESKPEMSHLVNKANEYLEAVKHSIVLLQIAKNTAFPVTGLTAPIILHYSDPEVQTGIAYGSECRESVSSGESKSPPASSSERTIVVTSVPTVTVVSQSPMSPNEKNPVFISYSSSDDEQDFYDASEDFTEEAEKLPPQGSEDGITVMLWNNISFPIPEMKTEPVVVSPLDTSGAAKDRMALVSGAGAVESSPSSGAPGDRGSVTPDFDWDSLYDEDAPEDDLGSVEGHGSVLSHLLSQVKIGMDLTKVVLPTFILERRSLLEMYADFFAHPDMFVSIADQPSPKDRIVAVLRWYLGAFHAGRPSEVAKKPYNPILGEFFQCHWNMKDCLSAKTAPDAPNESHLSSNSQRILAPNGALNIVNKNGTLFPWVGDQNSLVFLGEQVSHHPPISAFYAEHVSKKISLNAHIWTKSKFLGLSIGVNNIGHATLSIHSPQREDYVLGFPNGYARSILSVPWVELGGQVTISSAQTGYSAQVEFLTKPFFNGEKNKITAQVFSPEDKKKPFLTVNGEWNGAMMGKWSDGRTEKFVDVKQLKIIRKRTRPIVHQEVFESRRLWKDVTRGLKYREIDKATESKSFLEERQRQEARERSARGETWKPRFFIPAGDTWIFSEPLEQRLVQKRGNQQ